MLRRNRSYFCAPVVRACSATLFENLEQRQLLSLAGELDPTFGKSGWVVPAGANQNGGTSNDAIVQSDSKVIQAITSDSGALTVRRLRASGGLDSSYGKGGLVSLSLGSGSKIGKLLMLKDGSVIVGGYGSKSFALVHLKTDGSLDTNFGSKGMAIATFSSGAIVHDLALQGDGKIVAGGSAGSNIALARFNSNGTLDKSFDSDGKVQQNLPNNHEYVNALALQSDGKLIGVGASTDTNAHEKNTILRFTSSGKLDTSFNKTGYRVFGSINHALAGVGITSDKKFIVVSNTGSSQFGFDPTITITRLNANGSTDSSYGKSGSVSFGGLPPGSNNGSDIQVTHATDLVLQSDGKAVISGSQNTFSGNVFAAAFRVNTNGTPDAGFGKSGVAKFPVYETNSANAIVTAPGGKLVLSVNTSSSIFTNRPAVVRLNSNGTTDATFGLNGKVVENFEGITGNLHDVISQPDGKILAAGWTESPRNGGQDYMVIRFNADGSFDTSFGNGGVAVVDFQGNRDEAFSIALTSNGKILVGGMVDANTFSSSDEPRLGIARLNSNGTIDTSFGSGGKVIYGASTFSFTLTRMAVLSDGSIIGSLGGDVVRFTSAGVRDTSFAGDGTFNAPDFMRIDQIYGTPTGKILLHGNNDSFQFEVIQLNTNGTPDNSFGTNGILGPDLKWRGAILPAANNKFILADNGEMDQFGAPTGPVVIKRYLSNGTLDTTFGSGGTVQFEVPINAHYDRPIDLAYAPDGKIVVAVDVQYEFGGSSDRFAVGRVTSDGKLDTTFANGKLSVAPGPTETINEENGLEAVTVKPTGEIVEVGQAAPNSAWGVAQFSDEGDNIIAAMVDSNGVLKVTGTAHSDVIDIATSGSNVVVNRNGFQFTFPTADVNEISVSGGAGGDFVAVRMSRPTTVNGESGDDYLVGTGPSLLRGGDGNDQLFGGDSRDALFGDNGDDELNGNGNDDFLSGLAGNDFINGGGGNDVIDGGSGRDIMSGGPGTDTADYSHRTEALTITLDDINNDGAAGETDWLRNDIENVLGGSGNDNITGDANANVLKGNGGNDVIHGGDGNDSIDGGAGRDQLFGEGGNDTFSAQDGEVDSLDGGAGADTASRDNSASVKDQVMNIESFV